MMAPDNDTPEREQQVAELLRTAAQSERAPESLQARVSAMRARAEAPARRGARGAASGGARGSWLPRPVFNLISFAMPAAAAVAVALVLALGGGAGTPSIAQAAALATRAPSAAAPATDPSDPAKLLTAKVGSLHFPNWQAAGGWHATGRRSDQLGNRMVTTVYYATGSSRVVYSIVSSPVLPGLDTRGDPYAVIWRHGRATVIWEEAGHTCLLSGTGTSPARLWQLASLGFRQALG